MAKNINSLAYLRQVKEQQRQVHAYSTFTLFCNPSSTDKMMSENFIKKIHAVNRITLYMYIENAKTKKTNNGYPDTCS